MKTGSKWALCHKQVDLRHPTASLLSHNVGSSIHWCCEEHAGQWSWACFRKRTDPTGAICVTRSSRRRRCAVRSGPTQCDMSPDVNPFDFAQPFSYNFTPPSHCTPVTLETLCTSWCQQTSPVAVSSRNVHAVKWCRLCRLDSYTTLVGVNFRLK